MAHGNDAEPAALGHRGRQLEVHRARHRRQHDRMLDLEQVDQTAVRPHGGCLARIVASLD